MRRCYSVRAYIFHRNGIYVERGRYLTLWGAKRTARRMNRIDSGWIVEKIHA